MDAIQMPGLEQKLVVCCEKPSKVFDLIALRSTLDWAVKARARGEVIDF